MKVKDYWLQRDIVARDRLVRTSIADMDKYLIKQYQRVEENIQKEMELLYNQILLEGGSGDVLISHLYKYNRYYELMEKINAELTSLGKKEKTKLKKNLTDLYNDNYLLIGKQLGIVTDIKPEEVKKVIMDVWCSDGKTWTDRIWTNKGQLLESLSNGLIDCVASGKSSDVLVERIMKDCGSSYNNASRLARTELSHIYNQSAIDKYTDSGITKVQYLTARDERTCETCQSLEGKIFPIEDAPTIPRHPNCLCTWLAVIE